MTLTTLRESLSVTARDLPFIGGDALRQLISVADAIEASRKGFLAAARGEIVAPLRSALFNGRVLIMPAEHKSGSGLIKVINPWLSASKGVAPGIDGTVLWIDGGVGSVGALLDVIVLTALRTGAASGLATSMLARDDAAVLAMIGSGTQAMDQIAAVCAVRPITEVRIYSRNSDHSLSLHDRVIVTLPGIHCRTVEAIVDAVRGADVICTATRSTEPLFGSDEIASTVHINAIGAYRPEMCEVPAAVFGKATKVVVDEIAASLAEAGDVIQALEAGALHQDELVEMGNLLEAPAERYDGVTIFKSVGIAAQDWSMAELAVQRARDSGLLLS